MISVIIQMLSVMQHLLSMLGLLSIKKDFRKITAEIRKTGSGELPPQERYIHFDNMKEITLSDPSFFPSMLMETDHVVDEVVAEAVISICYYDDTEPVLTTGTRRTMPSELQQAFLKNSRSQNDIMASMHKLLSTRYQIFEELYEDTLQQYRLDVTAPQEARRLDWESRELIATCEYNRRVIADEREEELRRSLLEIFSRCKRSRSPLSSLTHINE
ncbi:hypothetical protein J3Q64DRAFT_1704642 [Phycomyces blakesleeanus]|uniref:Uncharacterized protein n=2 Tax=Phycomyces blakesleeanus TaxID=4837 RepID=A0A163BH52_PHYB8|nr:hypothetical protein PHYBLDRAFT_73453 [Phycomyces blakesleeanus NRRL 1555(-)]OAD81561.1 hypothetical protein PHYBLDRAFT_73453 [Phycomyces blakesleeanus NRRL 1555(-)]|eukprot:XP_018299601.1 hypothetical protein PHYBLDRAFT_73453 [Phycomyces blakesleeanus NRRL 1555(-)]